MHFSPCSFKLPGHCTPHHLLLSSSAEEFDLHNDRLLWELSLPQNFVVARSHHISDRRGPRLVSGSLLAMSAHWPRSTVCQGWQLGRRSCSQVIILHTSVPKVTLVTFVYPSLLGASTACPPMALNFPGLPVWIACWHARWKTYYLISYGKFSM